MASGIKDKVAIIGMGCSIAAILGIVASLAPSLSVARMSVVQGLKTLD